MLRTLLPVVVSVALSLGCTRWVEVRPDQLGTLERARVERVGQDAALVPMIGRYGHRTTVLTTTPVVESTRQTVLRPDGRTVEIVGRFDLRLTADGAVTRFAHPVLVERSGDTLLIAGAETPQAPFALAAIERAEVSQGAGAPIWVGIALSAVAIGLMAAHYVE